MIRLSASYGKLFTILLMAQLSATPLPAQQDSAAIPAPTIRVSSRLVLVDVVVTDKQGKPVKDLKPADFVVQENGKNQKISVFVPPLPAQQAAPASPPPGISSNRPEFIAPKGPLTVLLLDAVNTPFKDQAYARGQMLKYIHDQYKPGDRIAVYTLTNALNQVQPFTSDPAVLQAALEKAKPWESRLVAKTDPRPLSAALGPSAGGPESSPAIQSALASVQAFQDAAAGYNEERRVQITLAALQGLANTLGGVPGRKKIIWLTAGFPFTLIPEERNVSAEELNVAAHDIRSTSLQERTAGETAARNRQAYTAEIRQAAAQLAAAQVAMYPVDVRGLAVELGISDTQDTLREIARETGGRAYVNQNEIKEGVAMALQDDDGTYTVGYYPDNKKWDGKYRNLKVRVDRDGTEVHHRRGYYAIDPTQNKDKDSDQLVAQALMQSAPSTLVAFSSRLKPGSTPGGKVTIEYLVDAHTLSADDASGGAKSISAQFFAAAFSPDGKLLNNSASKVEQNIPAADFQQILDHGLLFRLDFQPQAGSKFLRVAVRDNKTGYLGTTEIPLP
jgi:VWFA-related protein